MLHQMCHDTLSNADVKAISQCRGFSAAEAASRALFESFFLSDIGVASALRLLSPSEVVLLHLLHSRTTPVDIAFFSRVYPASGAKYGSFTQRYQSVLQEVRASLIRRGLLIMAESGYESDGETKMERWRFHFPQQFARLLPPLIEDVVPLDRPGTPGPATVNHVNTRRKVLSAVKDKQFGLAAANTANYQMSITHGELRMGDQHFQVATLRAWQQACWEAATPKAQPDPPFFVAQKTAELSYVAAATYAFAQLPPNVWLTPAQLTPLLQVFCDEPKPQTEKLCVAGWEWGCLARQTVNNSYCYALPKDSLPNALDAATTRQPGSALTIIGEQIIVDLANIDYGDLEILAQIATWQIEKGQVIASPSLIKLGTLQPAVRNHPLLQWLQANVPVFAQALRTVARRWGKQIVHENLLVAKINDLSLKVIIQKALATDEQLLVLPNNFIAFARALLPTIDKLVKQSGHVIKLVQPPKTP